MKPKKFKADDEVLYCTFPDSEFGNLANERRPAIVLYVFGPDENLFYDYIIYILDNNKRKKVREENLFSIR